MKIIPEALKRNLGMKLLALLISMVVYFAMREEVATLPLPAGVRAEFPTELVIVTESADGTAVRESGRLVRDPEGKGYKWVRDEVPASPKEKPAPQPQTAAPRQPPALKGSPDAAQADR